MELICNSKRMCMKLIKCLALFVSFCSMHTLVIAQETVNESDLYGSWNCKHQVEDSNTKIRVKIDYNVNFNSEGGANGKGTAIFIVQNLPELKYNLSDVSTWAIIGNTLILTSTQIKSVNVSHPELGKLLNLNKLIPNKVSESSYIMKLTKKRLIVKSQLNEQVIACTKNLT